MEIVSRKANIPLYELSNEKIKNVKKLEKKLKDKIIGQDQAISKLIDIYKQIKLGFNDNVYSMMFAGSSGVGKSHLAKLFGKYMSKSVIKLDMSEYTEPHSVSKIIGSPAGYVGYNDNKNILEKIKNNPFSIIILDEIEKAHRNILDLLFQILDDGIIKDATGSEVNFRNCIIIMTTNIGFEKQNIGFNSNNTNKLKEAFGIPFINRIDNIINFNRLNRNDINKIIHKRLIKLEEKYDNINIEIRKEVINDIIEDSNYLEYGARQIDKIIKKYIVPQVIATIINNEDSIKIKHLKEKETV